MAERQGFEPWDGVNRRRFSRPVLSTTQPPLQNLIVFNYLLLLFFLPVSSTGSRCVIPGFLPSTPTGPAHEARCSDLLPANQSTTQPPLKKSNCFNSSQYNQLIYMYLCNHALIPTALSPESSVYYLKSGRFQSNPGTFKTIYHNAVSLFNTQIYTKFILVKFSLHKYYLLFINKLDICNFNKY